jgi:hypothetical protein
MGLKNFLSSFDTKKLLLYFSIAIIFTVFAIKIFMVLNFPIILNEDFFATRATALNQGKIPFIGNQYNNHGPFTVYFLSLFSHFFTLNYVNLHLAGLFWDILLLLLIFFMCKKYFGYKMAIVAIAIYQVLSFAFYSIFYGSEYPSAFFGLLGIFFYFLFLEKSRKYNLFLSGIMIGISIWFKQPGFFVFLAILFHQIYLLVKKQENTKSFIKNTIIVALGSLCVGIPLMIYFFYITGWKFLQDMILFNLLAKTRNSRILVMGRCLRMLAEYFGFLFIIIFATPKKTKSDNESKIMSFCLIFTIIMIIFYMMNIELFTLHFIALAPVLIILVFFSLKHYEGDSLKLIRVLLIIGLMTIFLINLEDTLKYNARGEKLKQEQIAAYLSSEIPKGSNVFSVYDLYAFLGGFESTYDWTTLQPNVESIDNFSDFCGYLDNVDYIIFTDHQKKYLGEKNLECAYSKFNSIKTFENVGESNVEILRRKNG